MTDPLFERNDDGYACSESSSLVTIVADRSALEAKPRAPLCPISDP